MDVFIVTLLILCSAGQLVPVPSDTGCAYYDPGYTVCLSGARCWQYLPDNITRVCCSGYSGNQCLLSPHNVRLSATSPYSVHLTWRYPPMDDVNSNLTHFSISCPPDRVQVVSATQRVWDVDSLNPNSSYNCCVTANYTFGFSSPVCDIETTPKGVPPPTIISADRTEATKALLKWENLNLEDLRRNMVSYEIVYYDLSQKQCPDKTFRSTGNKTVSVMGREPYAIITNLDPTLEYCVGVAANAGAGIGEFSYTTIPLYTSSVFTVGFEKCTQWNLEMPLLDMVQKIAEGINRSCHCQFTSDYIGDGRLLCDQEGCQRVLFQGRIISTNDRNSTELLQDLEEWVSLNPKVVIQEEQVQIVSNKTQPHLNCDKHDKSDTSSATAGGIMAVILVLLCVITATVLGVIYCKWKFTKKQCGFKHEVIYHEVAVTLSTGSADVVLKELPNPLYCQRNTLTTPPAEYEVPHQQAEQHGALANPTYDIIAEPQEPNGEPASIPTHCLTSPQHITVISSNEHVYSEVDAKQEGHIYHILTHD